MPLQHVLPHQPRFDVYDSVLSEEAVLGFEYGYSTTEPNALDDLGSAVRRLLQRGADHHRSVHQLRGSPSGAACAAWCCSCPTATKAPGPSTPRRALERFLQLCAENNIQVCVPSTPAQMFHMLRRQMLRAFRKPLIVMTPKSMLRNELSVSSLADLTKGAFAAVIDEVDDLLPAQVRRLVFCSGKVYFDLLKARRKENIRDVALLRIEQLYPFPNEGYEAAIKRYPNVKDVVWCQEEPQNQGAWYQIRHRLDALSRREVLYAGRAPAGGAGDGPGEDPRDRTTTADRGRAAGHGAGGFGARHPAPDDPGHRHPPQEFQRPQVRAVPVGIRTIAPWRN